MTGTQSTATNNKTFNIYNILYLLQRENGEELVQKIISSFSCTKNDEIQSFLKNKAIRFAQDKKSITYFVFNTKHEFVGYFTILFKTSKIKVENLIQIQNKEYIENCAETDEDGKEYIFPAYLIAQIGKNENVNDKDFNGHILMKCATGILTDVQRRIGGSIIFLECENEKKLIDFYTDKYNGFVHYGERKAKSGITYLQLLKTF